MKNFVLKLAAVLMALVFMGSACMLDVAYTSVPVIVCIISGGYLALFAYANYGFGDYEEEEPEIHINTLGRRRFSRADIIDFHVTAAEEERLNA